MKKALFFLALISCGKRYIMNVINVNVQIQSLSVRSTYTLSSAESGA